MNELSALLRKALTLTGAYNSGHTATLCSAQISPAGRDSACPQNVSRNAHRDIKSQKNCYLKRGKKWKQITLRKKYLKWT